MLSQIWTSSEQLAGINRIVQFAMVVLGISTAALGAASFVLTQRKASLDDQNRRDAEARMKQVESRAAEIQPLKYRKLSEEQLATIRDGLAGTAGTTAMIVRNNSAESQTFSQQLERILSAAGWKLQQALPGNLRKPVSFRVGRNENLKESKGYDALVQALGAIGVTFKATEFGGNFDEELLIDVGVVEATPYQAALDKIQ
jgi:outer membrane usher protein FimD/PapC